MRKQVFFVSIIHLSVQIATNAFVPIGTERKVGVDIALNSCWMRRKPTISRHFRLNSNNNCVDENENKKDLLPSPSSRSGHIEFIFGADDVNEDGDLDNLARAETPSSTPSISISSASNKNVQRQQQQQQQQEQEYAVSESLTTTNKNEEDVNLKAVLAASGEAAALAEATLSPKVVEQLDELATAVNINATTNFETSLRRSSVSIDQEIVVPNPPETVATINPHPHVTGSMVVGSEELKGTSFDEDFPDKFSEEMETTGDNNNQLQRQIDISAPSVGKILKFAIPAIGVWLCSPLLSLIDTGAVGVLSGTTQQAALNPAVAITDYAALLIAFLYTGTTNMVATAQGLDHGTDDKPRTAKMMVGAMQMSTYVGVLLGSILFAFARPLLTAIIGNDDISPAVFAAAMKYVRIRALGMPAAAVIGSTQAACLGMQDVRSPLYVLVAAAVVNLFGDVLFVGQTHPLLGGAAGAAWATVLSQFAAVTFFFQWLRKPARKMRNVDPPQVMNLSDAILEITCKSNSKNGKKRRQSLRNIMENLKLKNEKSNLPKKTKFSTQSGKTKIAFLSTPLKRKKRIGNGNRRISIENAKKKSSNSFSARGFLSNRFSVTDILRFPEETTRKEFAPYILPVTTTQVGRVSGYVAMSHVVASSLGTISMAAQQVIVSIFYCLCPIADSLSLTAQSLVPTISEMEPSYEKAESLKKVLMNFLKAGAVFGVAMMTAVSAIPLLSGLFTSDQAVISLVNSVVPLLLVFFGVHGVLCGMEGMLLGQKDLGFLGQMYFVFFAIVPFAMLQVKKMAINGTRAVGLRSVWSVFIGYQICRCALWLARSFILQRRTEKEAKTILAP